jgi:Tol biopolymer transport system component
LGWSRDGQKIVYDTMGQVYIYHLDTGMSTPFAPGNNPTWSPDGSLT